ncbi:hypothetical protein AVEN_173738-2-1, partial [Araneus ventricosus]
AITFDKNSHKTFIQPPVKRQSPKNERAHPRANFKPIHRAHAKRDTHSSKKNVPGLQLKIDSFSALSCGNRRLKAIGGWRAFVTEGPRGTTIDFIWPRALRETLRGGCLRPRGTRLGGAPPRKGDYPECLGQQSNYGVGKQRLSGQQS